MTPSTWCARVDHVVSNAGGHPDAVSPNSRPVVVLVGAYNTGKTTLLRRLLTDKNAPVPEWARVSAREETATTNRVDALGCTLVDTPGLEALSRWHSSEANDALLEADAIMLLTTSSLFATEARKAAPDASIDALAIASGRVFANAGVRYPASSLAVLVTRFDEAGLDPTEFPEEYDVARRCKLVELADLLRRRAPNAADVSYLGVVAPDPFGRTRNRAASSGDYDPYRSWDGVAEVVAWLESLPPRAAELRAWREVRARAATLTRRIDVVQAALQGEQRTVADARAGRAQAVSLTARCDREWQAAAARLTAAIERAVFSGPDPRHEQFTSELRGLLETELRQWADDTWQALQTLAQEGQTSLPEITRGDAVTAAEHLVRLTQQPSGWQQKANIGRQVIDMVRECLAAFSVDADQPGVRDPGGPPGIKWLNERTVEGVDTLLLAASALLAAAEEGGRKRSEELEYHWKRLSKEGASVARQMFTTPSSPNGWEKLFEELRDRAQESVDNWSIVMETAQTRSTELKEALLAMEALLDDCPQP